MATREITEKEFAVIREISNNNLPDQRTIATKTGLSLGLTNLIIKKLIKTGCIKIKQLNQRKIQYILTPKGFSEKARKSYRYALKTINMLKTIKEKIQNLILEFHRKGIKQFIIVGNNEIADITEIAFKTISNSDKISYFNSTNVSVSDSIEIEDDTVIFYTDTNKTNIENKKKFKIKPQNNVIYLFNYLSDAGIFL